MKVPTLVVALLVSALSGAQSGLTVSPGRSVAETRSLADGVARRFAKNVAALTKSHRAALAKAGRYDKRIPFSLPTVVSISTPSQFRVSSLGIGDIPNSKLQTPNSPFSPPPAPSPFAGTNHPENGEGVHTQSGDITLAFDSSGPRAFPQVYRDYLQSVFDQSKTVLSSVFGQPALPGVVRVRNYDADIGDRDAIAGGYFMPDNGAGEMEIAFPVYNAKAAAGVNFVHCLLLAYQGQNPYAFDAFEEGLVRAATMKVVRTPGAMPILDQNDIPYEDVIVNNYDVSTWYDWYNQRALGGPIFIAPNLRDVPLPPGGSTGGLYLLRYQMAGTVWEKVLAEHPAFISEFNSRYYADTSIKANIPALVALGQQVLDFLRLSDPTIEGNNFAQWFRRQYILETETTFGTKLLVQPIPIDPQFGTDDYGVFDLWTHYFDTDLQSNEVLLSGTSFPIFWEDFFNRFSTSAQDDRMSIAGGFGDVAPNFPNQVGTPYRVTVDIPVQDQLARVYLPAGAIATGSNPTPNDFYGTVVGLDPAGGATGKVRIYSLPSQTLLAEAPVTAGAFGVRIDSNPFLLSGPFEVRVVRTEGGLDQDVLVRRVDKGPGALALDLRIQGETTYTFPGGLPKGITAFGLPLEPFSSSIPQMLGLVPNDVLAARYNPAKTRYDLYPELEPFKQGHGFFVRMESPTPLVVDGRTSSGTPTAVALRPGWNMISTPINETVPTTRVRVVRAAEFPKAFADSLGVELGLDFFSFTRGPNDGATGAPETGTMTAATSFEPGKMYFARVLAPEGSSLLFEPQTQFSPGGGSGPRAMGSGAVWQVQVSLIAPKGYRADSFIGASSTGSSGFDPREDSGIPPGIGGLQIWSQGVEALYRDTRNIAKNETFKMRLDGLQRGYTYTLKLVRVKGQKGYLSLYDADRKLRFNIPANGQYVFTASSGSKVIELTAQGGGN